jgi:asparagine synthetase B (glutamine-hydrolysing)
MLIRAGEITREAAETNALSTPAYDICWSGFAYRKGFLAGAPSLGEFNKVCEADIPRAAADLKGAYFVAISCKESGNTYAFVDPAGLYHSYYSSRMIGTSFLRLSREEKFTSEDINPEALVEFFHQGCIYEDKTLFRGINKISPFSVVRSNPWGSTEVLPKPVADISEAPKHSLESLLRDFADAAKNDFMSMDITGGVDSRLLTTVFSYFGVPFEMASSGRPGIPDIEIAAKVAAVLGHPFHATYHSAEQANWDELFYLSDGMFDVTKNSRYIQLQKDRRGRGCTLSVSGTGGELYKDFWWLQDFPFYSRRRPHLARLYSYRIAARAPQHSLLRERYRRISEGYRDRALHSLGEYTAPSNTKTYDRIYYYYKMRGFAGCFLSSGSEVLRMGMPYLDPEAVSIGYNLPRSQRLLNRFHRKTISHYSRRVAGMPTTEGGVSSASGGLAISLDLGRYVLDRCKRLTKKIGERVLGTTFFLGSPDDPRLKDELLHTLTDRRTTELLADCQVLKHPADPQSLPARYLGSIFVLGRFFQEIGDRQPIRSDKKAISPQRGVAGVSRSSLH